MMKPKTTYSVKSTKTKCQKKKSNKFNLASPAKNGKRGRKVAAISAGPDTLIKTEPNNNIPDFDQQSLHPIPEPTGIKFKIKPLSMNSFALKNVYGQLWNVFEFYGCDLQQDRNHQNRPSTVREAANVVNNQSPFVGYNTMLGPTSRENIGWGAMQTIKCAYSDDSSRTDSENETASAIGILSLPASSIELLRPSAYTNIRKLTDIAIDAFAAHLDNAPLPVLCPFEIQQFFRGLDGKYW